MDDPDEFVLDDDEPENRPEDLDRVLQDALEAVERSERPHGVADDGATEPGVAGDAEAAANGAEVANLEAELDRTQDRLIRALADFDNFRKRTDKERREDRRYAGVEVLRDLLPVVDNLERALEAPGEVDDLKTGVQLILRQVEDLLRRHGVSKIEAAGRPFDPNTHDALSREENASVAEPTVSEELLAGYEMYDRLLRPAQVRVAMPPDPSSGGGEPTGEA